MTSQTCEKNGRKYRTFWMLPMWAMTFGARSCVCCCFCVLARSDIVNVVATLCYMPFWYHLGLLQQWRWRLTWLAHGVLSSPNFQRRRRRRIHLNSVKTSGTNDCYAFAKNEAKIPIATIKHFRSTSKRTHIRYKVAHTHIDTTTQSLHACSNSEEKCNIFSCNHEHYRSQRKHFDGTTHGTKEIKLIKASNFRSKLQLKIFDLNMLFWKSDWNKHILK